MVQSTIYLFECVTIVFFIIFVVEYNFIRQWTIPHRKKDIWANQSIQLTVPPDGYLVWNTHCHMPDVNPFTKEAMKVFGRLNYTRCSDEPSLTNITFNTKLGVYILQIDEKGKAELIEEDDDVSCCYQSILRSGSGEKTDKEFKLESCVSFEKECVLPADVDSVIVKCKSVKKDIEVQKDAYFLVPEKPEVRHRLKFFKGSNDIENPISVLLWGIDSMSRFNLRRAMPKTTERLLNDNWFELSGYNKMDDNTFPNLMALLSGYNLTTAYSKCNLPSVGGLDNCNLIWDLYRQLGYVTGYAEDETFLSTFDYNIQGFKKVPVDYYQRPFMLAIEDTLPVEYLNGMKYCIGRRHSAEYVYDFALELGTRYRGEPYFALVWTNTFTHNGFDGATAMDSRVVRYIEQMKELGILDDSIVIFLSDHGARFGRIRNLKEGFIEERSPFLFIWLPLWFREKHPDFVQALEINQYRLTNPYDVHMTLKHILELSGRTKKLPQAEDCQNCQSLFVPVREQRSCQEIAIHDHWCTCVPYENVPTGDKEIVDGVTTVIDYLNLFLINGSFTPSCRELELDSVHEAFVKVDLEPGGVNARNNSDTAIYRIRFSAKPKSESNGEYKHIAELEVSLNYLKESKTYEIIDRVSRLDSYADESKCIEDTSAKMYCICSPTAVKPSRGFLFTFNNMFTGM